MSDHMRIIHGDSKEVLAKLPDNCIDAFVTDPPYGLSKEPDIQEVLSKWANGEEHKNGSSGFMGKAWDSFVPNPNLWKEAYRTLKHGSYLLAFAGTRTQGLMATSLEFGGFTICDQISWLYGSGFPKSLDVSKAIDKSGGLSPREQSEMLRTKRVTAGLTRDQVAEVVGCTPSSVRDWEEGRAREAGGTVEFIVPSDEYRGKLAALLGYSADERRLVGVAVDRRGDGSVYDVGHSGELRSGGNTAAAKQWSGWGTALKPAHEPIIIACNPYEDGSLPTAHHNWIPFFYTSKAAKKEKNKGCDHLFWYKLNTKEGKKGPWRLCTEEDYEVMKEKNAESGKFKPYLVAEGNNHPTVKPISIMEWLIELLPSDAELICDPFLGSGSTALACQNKGKAFVGIELEEPSVVIAKARLGLP